MKKVLYITVFLLFVTACSNNKSVKEVPAYQTAPKLEEVKQMSDSLEIKPNFTYTGGGSVFKNDKLATQKIQQLIDIALLLKQDSITADLKKNALRLAKQLYKSKEIQTISHELSNLDVPKCDSIRISPLELINIENTDDLINKTTYGYEMRIYKGGLLVAKTKKTALLTFENIRIEMEGKTIYSMRSKVLEMK